MIIHSSAAVFALSFHNDPQYRLRSSNSLHLRHFLGGFTVRFLALAIFFLVSIDTHAKDIHWYPNDLSILMPIPKTLGNGDLLRTNDQGAKGELLPWSRMQSLPILSADRQDKADEYASLRAVGIRIDPCFPAETECQRQIRIVWQELLETEGQVLTLDATAHSFYQLSEAEFQAFLIELQKLKVNSASLTNGPLWVHPVIQKEGLNGNFARRLRELVLQYVGERNLNRITFMMVRGPSIVWAFGGINIDFETNVATTLSIPRLGGTPDRPAKLQTFMNRTSRHDVFQQSDLRPAPVGPDTFNLLMRDSSHVRPVEDRAEILSSLEGIYRIENPNHHNSETSDCVSCHTAQPARALTVSRFGQLGLPGSAEAFAYRSPFDLRNLSPKRDSTRNLRAFGYFEQEPAISQRMIHEAAAVAELLNAQK